MSSKTAVEKHEIRYLSSGRDLLPPAAAKVKVRGSMVLADPDFDLAHGKKGVVAKPAASDDDGATRTATLGKVHFARLPGTAAEMKLINWKSLTGLGQAFFFSILELRVPNPAHSTVEESEHR